MSDDHFDWSEEEIISSQAAIATYISDDGYVVIRQERDGMVQETDQLVTVLPGNVKRLVRALNNLLGGA